jgi:hypothetical protein
MLMYALIGLSLMLVGIAGLQFSYLFYADRLNKERRKMVAELEHRCQDLTARLETAEHQVAVQAELIDSLSPLIQKEDETWADVIEER